MHITEGRTQGVNMSVYRIHQKLNPNAMVQQSLKI